MPQLQHELEGLLTHETQPARVNCTPSQALSCETLWALVGCTPPLAQAIRTPLARVQRTPPLANAKRPLLARVQKTPPLVVVCVGGWGGVCCVLCVVLCVLCVVCCFTVSLHNDACDVTTQLAPDAPSPRRIQTACMLGHPSPTQHAHGPSPCSWGRMSSGLHTAWTAPSRKVFVEGNGERPAEALAPSSTESNAQRSSSSRTYSLHSLSSLSMDSHSSSNFQFPSASSLNLPFDYEFWSSSSTCRTVRSGRTFGTACRHCSSKDLRAESFSAPRRHIRLWQVPLRTTPCHRDCFVCSLELSR